MGFFEILSYFNPMLSPWNEIRSVFICCTLNDNKVCLSLRLSIVLMLSIHARSDLRVIHICQISLSHPVRYTHRIEGSCQSPEWVETSADCRVFSNHTPFLRKWKYWTWLCWTWCFRLNFQLVLILQYLRFIPATVILTVGRSQSRWICWL